MPLHPQTQISLAIIAVAVGGIAFGNWQAEILGRSGKSANYVVSQYAAYCGNGIKDPGEQCDDGNDPAGGCSPGCFIETEKYQDAYWTCHDGSQGKGDGSCRFPEEWLSQANAFCNSKCGGNGKCGMNSYSAGRPCGQSVQQFCTDSDGENYFTAGKVHGSQVFTWDKERLQSVATGVAYDYCEGSRLYEARCAENCGSAVGSSTEMCNYFTYTDCQFGCQNGACQKESGNGGVSGGSTGQYPGDCTKIVCPDGKTFPRCDEYGMQIPYMDGPCRSDNNFGGVSGGSTGYVPADCATMKCAYGCENGRCLKPSASEQVSCCFPSGDGVGCEQWSQTDCSARNGTAYPSCQQCWESYEKKKKQEAPKVSCCFPSGDGVGCEQWSQTDCSARNGTAYPSCQQCWESYEKKKKQEAPKVSCCFPSGDGVGCEQWSQTDCSARNGTAYPSCQQCWESYEKKKKQEAPKVSCCFPAGGGVGCEDWTQTECSSRGGTAYSSCQQCWESYEKQKSMSNPSVLTAPLPVVPQAQFEDEVRTMPVSLSRFADVDSYSLDGSAANVLAERGIIGGFPDGTFRPERPVNRAEAAKFLLLARFGTVEEQQGASFRDLLQGEWYMKYVIAAANAGIIGGYADGTFRPAQTVNTAEFLKMLTKTFGLSEGLPHTYSDVSADSWFADYAGIAQQFNLFVGRTSQLYPERPLTRGEVSIAIHRLLEALQQ